LVVNNLVVLGFTRLDFLDATTGERVYSRQVSKQSSVNSLLSTNLDGTVIYFGDQVGNLTAMYLPSTDRSHTFKASYCTEAGCDANTCVTTVSYLGCFLVNGNKDSIRRSCLANGNPQQLIIHHFTNNTDCSGKPSATRDLFSGSCQADAEGGFVELQRCGDDF
jgi:hypothetical protein